MSFYVYRSHPDGRDGWVGPIRSERQAGREKNAWTSCGWEAVIHPSTAETRAVVRSRYKRTRRPA